MNIDGYWFEVGSSTRLAAKLECEGQRYRLVSDSELLRDGDLTDLRISDRVGNINRKLYWPDDSLFESADNDAIDQLISDSNLGGKPAAIAHKLEKSSSVAVIAVVASVALGVLFFMYGLPAASKSAALNMPVSAAEGISAGAMNTMDKFFFKPTKLDIDEQDRWEARFNEIVAQVPNEGFSFKFHMREMHGIPNAMALPGGDIVFTDAFINLVEDEGEFDSVLLHEIGHVVERHGLQQIVHASSLSIIVALTIGDVSGIGELATSTPIFLMESKYSRDSESSADEYSFRTMMALGIDPKHFSTIINKLGEFAADDSDIDNKDEIKASDYLSSHPATKNRALRALEMSKEFNAQR